MISPQLAERLCNELVNEYMHACGCVTDQDRANVLMKMLSVTGLAIAAQVGVAEAVARIQGTAAHVSRFDTRPNTPPH